MKNLALLLLLCASLLCDFGSAQIPAGPPEYWYPTRFRPQIFVRGAVAGVPTTVCALYVEYSSPTPTAAIFIIGKYSKQYVQVLPKIGVLHIPCVYWGRHFRLKDPYNPSLIEFPLFSGLIHPSLRGTEWCLQAYFTWGEWNKWGEPHWLSYPVRVIIQ